MEMGKGLPAQQNDSKSMAWLPTLLLLLLMAAYAVYFSWYSINRHNTLNSYAADLSLIDQPLWNTVMGPGAFMELTWGDRQQPRLAEHFEPLLVPLALLFFLWDDVRLLLVLQSIALALGALPVFWIARQQLAGLIPFPARYPTLPTWAGLVFAAAFLLYPHLQAANIADFHADPFVVTPLLLAFWAASRQRWGWLWLWALLAMATKETLPTLTAMLGLWLAASSAWRPVNTGQKSSVNPAVFHGLALVLVSAGWFLLATFGVVAPLARQYFGTDGPIYFASRYGQGLPGVAQLLQEPARWSYLLGLLAPAGFLPLLAPDLLLLGLPVLLANMLSNFPGQYSGEQHYSAPLAAVFILAAIYGARRLVHRLPAHRRNGQSLRITGLAAASLWLLSWSLGCQVRQGWTPLSVRTETYSLSSAARRLPGLLDSIPPQAVTTASAAVHPHLAHRQVIYVFPTVQEADYLLVDVTDIPGVHPNDARAKLLQLLQTGWRLLAADDGLLLAQKSPAATPVRQLPDNFYNFARADGEPAQLAPIGFGDGRLRLLGYDVIDDPDNGVSFRFYWQNSGPLPEDLRLWPLVYDDQGQLLSDPTQTPMIAALWYPPAMWRPGETVVTETLPQLLPEIFHLGLAVGSEDGFVDPGRRYPITTVEAKETWPHPAGRWIQLASFRRQGPFLTHLPARPTLRPLKPVGVSFGQHLRLVSAWTEAGSRPGSTLPVVLLWQADATPQLDLTVFIHLLAGDGRLVAQSDAVPTWLTPAPTSRWSAGQPQLDGHRLFLPADLSPGLYSLEVGLYRSDTLERQALTDGRSTFLLGQVRVEE